MKTDNEIYFGSLKSFYITVNIKEHRHIKDTFQKFVKDIPINKFPTISNTDYPKYGFKNEFCNSNSEKFYNDYFIPKIRPYLNKISKRLTYKNWGWRITSIWFQIYSHLTKDFHTWHNHSNINYACVYYVKLPNKSVSTEFFDIVNKKPMKKINVKEGQLLIFPSHLLHRSPPNKTNDEKIIISFNCNINSEK